MADENRGPDDRSPEEEFQELMRRLMSGDTSGIDPEQLSRLSGMQIDPAMLQQVMNQLQGAFAGTQDGVDWSLAERQALHIANQDGLGVTTGQRTDLDQAFTLAGLSHIVTVTGSELLNDASRIPYWNESVPTNPASGV